MTLTSLIISILLILSTASVWFLLYYYNNKGGTEADGYAQIQGKCGDTMEIGLQVNDSVVTASQGWTDGCGVSKNCVEAAALLARGKEIEQVGRISMVDIMEVTGRLPETHLHCAYLAELTLKKSVENYHQHVS